MRHHSSQRKLGRDKDERAALLRSLARSLVLHGAISTTEAKAKELRPFIEKLVTAGKKGTIASRRTVASRLGSAAAAKRLVDEIAPRYGERPGGYTRIVKLGLRPGDAAKLAQISFVE